MTVNAPWKPNTPDLVAASFAAWIGKRRRVTVYAEGSYVVVKQTGASVTRSMFLWFQRNGWLREVEHRGAFAVYERVDRYAEMFAADAIGARRRT